jgi:hypothetical protein
MVNGRLPRTVIAGLVSSFVTIACGQTLPPVTVLERDSNPQGAEMGKPLFECGRETFNGGYFAYGHVLDDRGRIWFYRTERTSHQSSPSAGDGLFLEPGLKARYRSAVLQSLRVSPARLATMSQQAELARNGRVQRESAVTDRGISGCVSYLWQTADAYQRVELGTGGDVVVRNSAREADELEALLRGEFGMGQRPKPRM